MPIAVIMCIGILGLVLDIGIFRVIDSEFENAADAAALAAAWYDPVCPVVNQAGPPSLPQDPRCMTNPDNTQDSAAGIATRVATANLGLASKLCAGPPTISLPQIDNPPSLWIQSPTARAVSVVITCNAPYLAGAVLQVNGGNTQITRWATAALGSMQQDGTFAYHAGDSTPLVTSLVPL
jgi:hypothetical protein